MLSNPGKRCSKGVSYRLNLGTFWSKDDQKVPIYIYIYIIVKGARVCVCVCVCGGADSKYIPKTLGALRIMMTSHDSTFTTLPIGAPFTFHSTESTENNWNL
jgi:hypothetical protein